MSGVVYIRFFGDDWISGTQELSLEERGALITIVAMTATIGSAPALDYERLSRRFGCTPGRARKVIQTLADLGKIALEGEAIHNKRALIEMEISQKNSRKQSENASARWSKNAEKSNENNGGVDAMAKPWQCQPEPEPDNTPHTPQGVGDRFEEFWKAYPPRNGVKNKKALAKERYLRAIKKDAATHEQIMAGVEAMKHTDQVRRGFPRDASTWINQKGWLDEAASSDGGKPYKTDRNGNPEPGAVMVNKKGQRFRYINNFDRWMREDA